MSIRSLERRDLPALIPLFRSAFAESPAVPDERLAAYFERIFFDHPWYSADLPSLVAEEGGAIVGCLGVTPQRLTFRDQPIRLAVSNHFMVDPARRSLAGVQLLKHFFAGRQDLALAEGNESSRRIWTKLGGDLSVSYSIHWTSPLRPFGYAFAERPLLRTLAAPLDFLAARLPGPFRRAPSPLREESLDVAAFLAEVERVSKGFAVRPSYDDESASWLFDLLEAKRKLGRLRRSLLRDVQGASVGFAVWYENPGGPSAVVALGATPGRDGDVYAWLRHEAWQRGSTVLNGRFPPESHDALAAGLSIVSRNHAWMLLHARDPALLAAIHAGKAFLTRMEGEWWIPFHEV